MAREGLEGRVAGVCSWKSGFGVPGPDEFGQGLDNLCYRRHTLRMRKKTGRCEKSGFPMNTYILFQLISVFLWEKLINTRSAQAHVEFSVTCSQICFFFF